MPMAQAAERPPVDSGLTRARVPRGRRAAPLRCRGAPRRRTCLQNEDAVIIRRETFLSMPERLVLRRFEPRIGSKSSSSHQKTKLTPSDDVPSPTVGLRCANNVRSSEGSSRLSSARRGSRPVNVARRADTRRLPAPEFGRRALAASMGDPLICTPRPAAPRMRSRFSRSAQRRAPVLSQRASVVAGSCSDHRTAYVIHHPEGAARGSQ